MPLGLHPDCATRMREVLASVIPQLEVQRGMFLTAEALYHLREADAVLPDHGPARDALLRHVGERPASSFFFQRLNRSVLAECDEGPIPEGTQPLLSIPNHPDSAALANRLVDDLESLPWDYTITFAMPKALSSALAGEARAITLSDQFSVIVPSESFNTTYPLPDPDYRGGLLFPFTGYSPSGKWEDGDTYLQMRATGFIAPHGVTPPLLAAEAAVREFAGLGFALHLVALRRSYERNFGQPRFIVHRRGGDGWEFDCEPKWDSDQSRTFVELQQDNSFVLMTDEQKRAAALAVLAQMGLVFPDGDAHRVRRSAQWLFDSYCENDLPLALIQAAVVMEVLLGEKAASEAVGLAELLSNRLAYLIGRTQPERDRIVRQFKAIYDVRSRIVHDGKSTLSEYEHMQLWELRDLCQRVIRKEVDLLEEAARRRASGSTT